MFLVHLLRRGDLRIVLVGSSSPDSGSAPGLGAQEARDVFSTHSGEFPGLNSDCRS